MSRETWFTIGIITGIAIGILFGVIAAVDHFHDDLCHELFINAETPADSLMIIQNDAFCLEYSK